MAACDILRPMDPQTMPATAIVGAGHVGTVLTIALRRAGWPVTMVVSRDARRRARLLADLHGHDTRRGARLTAVPDVVGIGSDIELVLLTVPDDVVVEVAAGVPAIAGRGIAHTSGVHPAEALRPVVDAAMSVGSVHPLVAFADTDRALAALAGAAMAVDGDRALLPVLGRLVGSLDGRAIPLATGAKAAWHAAATLSAGGLVALLDVIEELAGVAGLDHATTHEVFQPLMRQSMANAADLGTRDALTGPVVRGDRGTIAAHLALMADRAPGAQLVYRALLDRQAALLDPDDALLDERRDAQVEGSG